jgi:hypothetical protein
MMVNKQTASRKQFASEMPASSSMDNQKSYMGARNVMYIRILLRISTLYLPQCRGGESQALPQSKRKPRAMEEEDDSDRGQ